MATSIWRASSSRRLQLAPVPKHTEDLFVVECGDHALGSAIISDDAVHRFELWRTWDDTKPRMTFVMLNPSTADAVKSDATITRCIGFAMREGCGAIDVVNLFSKRVTRPVHLFEGDEPEHPHNLGYVRSHIEAAGRLGWAVVAAWGASGYVQNSDTYDWLAKQKEVPLLCLGRTKDGAPRHPLYLKAETPLTAFVGPW